MLAWPTTVFILLSSGSLQGKRKVHFFVSYRLLYSSKTTTIVCLCDGTSYLSFLCEAANRCPDEFFLVLSSTWLIRDQFGTNVASEPPTGDEHDKPLDMYLKKGITMDNGGNSYIYVFNPPRRITYLFNSTTEDLGAVSCPSGCSTKVVNFISDVVFMRCMLASSGVTVLSTLAFPFKPSKDYGVDAGNVTVVPVNDCLDDKDSVKDAIMKFLQSSEVRTGNKVAVKAIGPQWKDENVCLVEVNEVIFIIDTVVELLVHADPDNVIYLEQVLVPVKRSEITDQLTTVQNISLPKKSKNLGVRLQTTVCRDPEDDAVVSSKICLIGERVAYEVTSDVCVQSLEDTLLDCGIRDDKDSQFIMEEVKLISEKILKVVQTLEGSTKTRANTMCQTDFIEIDFVMSRQDDQLTVIPVELRAHHSSFGHQIFQPLNTSISGDLWKPMIATMLNRSLGFLVKDKVVMVIGGGGFHKAFVYTSAKEYGIKICLIDEDPNHYANSMVDKFIHFDMSDHKLDREHCKSIIALVQNNGCHVIDGCVTFWDDCVPLAAMICQELCLTGSGVEATITAKTKSKTYQVLSSISSEVPFGCLIKQFLSCTYCINTAEDILPATLCIRMPAVMKPEYGGASRAAKLLTDTQDCYNFFEEYQQEVKKTESAPIVSFGGRMLLMEFVDGPEFGIDIVIFDQSLIAGFVHDKGPTRLPTFTKATSCFPTLLSANKETQLVFAAYLCCIGIGLKSGTFNLDMKMTTSGPKLLEINARLGGFDLRDSIKQCYKNDILLHSFAIACGIKPNIIKLKPTCSLINMYLMPSEHGHALHVENLKHLTSMKEKGLIKFSLFEQTLVQRTYEIPLCSIGVVEKECQLAKMKLESLCKFLGLGNGEVPLSYYLSYFQ